MIFVVASSDWVSTIADDDRFSARRLQIQTQQLSAELLHVPLSPTWRAAF